MKDTSYTRRNLNRKIFPTAIPIAVFLLAVLVLLGRPSTTNQSIPIGVQATAQATPTWSMQGFRATAEAIRATLPTRTLEPGWPEDKARDIAARDLSETAYATALALYPPPPGYRPEITPEPTMIYPTPIPLNTPTGDGIIRNGDPPNGPPCTMLYSTNWWSGQINGQQGEYYTLACAGADKEDKTLGAIVLQVGSHDSDKPVDVTYYRTTTHTGKLRIVGESNHTLTLQATDNSLLYFDLITRQWVNP